MLNRQAGIGRAELHRRPRRQVARIGQHHRQMGVEQDEGLAGEQMRDRIAADSHQAFHRVADSVETGGGSDPARLGRGQRRIEQGDAGQRLRSPQAILRWVTGSVISAYDWHSLPVPAVVGTAMNGSRGFTAAPVCQ